MLFSFFHFLSGYCKIVLSGTNQERFLNLCVAKKILLWNVKKEGKHYIFYISRGGYRELAEIAQKTGSKYQCVQKKGLPYLFYQYKKRKFLLLTLLVCIVVFCVMSCFVWQVQAVGSYSHSEEEMLDYLKKKGICSGTKISRISCTELEEQIRRDFEDIAWVSCEREGTLLRVRIKETLDKREKVVEREEEPCNLIASKAGKIDSILVRSGSAMVKPGDTVKAGDVLISGIVEIRDDAGELAEETAVRAQGDIYAISKVEYEDVFPMIQYKKIYTGKTQKNYRLLINGYMLRMPERKVKYLDYDEQSKEILLHIGPQFYLPASLFVITKAECQVAQKRYNIKDAKKKAEKRLALFLKEYERKGVIILKNNVRIDENKNECTAKGIITIRERVGKIQRISTALQNKQQDKEE